jgi:hypothetical protein
MKLSFAQHSGGTHPPVILARRQKGSITTHNLMTATTMMKQMLTKILSLVAIVLALPALAQVKPTSETAAPSREEHVLLSLAGRIEAIDYANREVTLKDQTGHVETFSVSEDVKRFGEAKVGDNVTVKYYAGFVAELRKPTPEEEKEPLVVLEGAGRASTSAAPSAGGVRRIKAVVTIEGLDRPTERITVKGPAGHYYVAHIADLENLTRMHIGDTIVVTLTEAAVVSLEKASDKLKL